MCGSRSAPLPSDRRVLAQWSAPNSFRQCEWMLRANHIRRRPYRVECTGSLLTSEVKRRRARLVLGWGTAREVLRVLSAFARPLLVQVHWGRLPCTFCLAACLSESANHGLLLLLENIEVAEHKSKAEIEQTVVALSLIYT